MQNIYFKKMYKKCGFVALNARKTTLFWNKLSSFFWFCGEMEKVVDHHRSKGHMLYVVIEDFVHFLHMSQFIFCIINGYTYIIVIFCLHLIFWVIYLFIDFIILSLF